MRSRILIALIAAVVLAPALSRAATAPEGRYNWITPMAGWIQQPNKLVYPNDSLADSPAGAARLGCEFAQNWGAELGFAYSPTKEAAGAKRDVTYMHFNLSALYTPTSWPLGAPYLALGVGRTMRSSTGFDNFPLGTFEQALGWQSWFSDKMALRLEARNVLGVPKQHWEKADKSDQQYWVGLTYAWGGKPRDSDGDGVPDRRDKCPATPAGASVDANGCPMDSDGDGVLDGLDKCPGTPRGAKVDASGCPTDSDGDGVFDGLDKCPDTPRGAKVDSNGCPIDSDGDGVYDGLDKCPNTSAGATVDASGCPVDSDGDGVADGLDKCPNTPAGAKVDADGCPIVVTEKETELLDTGMIRLSNINFETGKADLMPESSAPLDEIGAILRKWPQLQIEIGGHTDSRGLAKKNLVLSQARADAVRDYLVKKFPDIQGDQLTARGYGSAKPIAPNKGELNLAKNRRVEFVVLNKDVLKKESEKRKMLTK